METVICFLCRVTFQEKQGLKDHLIYEHGVMYNLDFVSRVSHFRTENARLPLIDINKKNNNRTCSKCQDDPPIKSVVDFPKTPKPNKVQVKLDISQTLDETVPMPSGADVSTVSEQPVKVKPKNIRDKTNKYCDVCDITLDTRLLFLSHCSNVHDVKFKGKSGQPLVIPKEADSSRVSLGQGDAEAGASPARKKMKLADTSLNTSMDPNNPRRAPVPCKFCGKIFSNVSNKERHERQSCKNADFQQIEEKEFKCKIVNCNRQFSKLGYLKKHMSSEHEQPSGNISD